MKARVTSESQSFRLVERMAEARISHGQELRADLSNVRVLALAGVAEVPALFCNVGRSEEHTSELQSLAYLVCRLLLEKKKKNHHSRAMGHYATNRRDPTEGRLRRAWRRRSR